MTRRQRGELGAAGWRRKNGSGADEKRIGFAADQHRQNAVPHPEVAAERASIWTPMAEAAGVTCRMTGHDTTARSSAPSTASLSTLPSTRVGRKAGA